MAKKGKIKGLKKELKLIDVYAIATGTTLSAGFFLLPGMAASYAGPAVILAYLIAAVPLIPSMFSIIELATAMPRAGGIYYFLDRSMGPMFGTIGGIGTWLALILKVAFALIGMGAYISLFIPNLSIKPIAISLAVILAMLNVFGAKKTGGFQVMLVSGLLIILAGFMFGGFTEINYDHFQNFFEKDFSAVISTAGLVYISYVGITKVASLSEEVKNPERNLPLAIFLSLGTALIVYGVGTMIMVGVIPMDELTTSLTPVAKAAEYFAGNVGVIVVSVAALLAFISVANAGTLSASRYPLAMSRDHIFPSKLKRLGKFNTPVYSIFLTMVVIVTLLVVLDPAGIAKLASAFQLLMFALVCFAVIIMRESKIDSYDPGYKSPLYPYMQIFGILSSLYLISQMGMLPIIFSSGLIVLGVAWYWFYARGKVARTGAIYHIFERLGQQRYAGLDTELRGILIEKGLRKGDPFDDIVMRSKVIDLDEEANFEDITGIVSEYLQSIMPLSSDEIKSQIMEGTRIGATPVTHGFALPHFRAEGIEHPEMVLVRSLKGVNITVYNPINREEEGEEKVFAVFYLVSPEKNPTQHLRILAQIAGRVDDDSFNNEWINAADEMELKEALLHDESFLSIELIRDGATAELINKPLYEIRIPSGCLIALIRRGENIIVPKGQTVLVEGDRLTILGDPQAIKEFRELFP
jgi:amino acid transporter/mannitol/fructose-specific phosphotransferase system IIA component (Ntr-type)